MDPATGGRARMQMRAEAASRTPPWERGGPKLVHQDLHTAEMLGSRKTNGTAMFDIPVRRDRVVAGLRSHVAELREQRADELANLSPAERRWLPPLREAEFVAGLKQSASAPEMRPRRSRRLEPTRSDTPQQEGYFVRISPDVKGTTPLLGTTRRWASQPMARPPVRYLPQERTRNPVLPQEATPAYASDPVRLRTSSIAGAPAGAPGPLSKDEREQKSAKAQRKHQRLAGIQTELQAKVHARDVELSTANARRAEGQARAKLWLLELNPEVERKISMAG